MFLLLSMWIYTKNKKKKTKERVRQCIRFLSSSFIANRHCSIVFIFLQQMSMLLHFQLQTNSVGFFFLLFVQFFDVKTFKTLKRKQKQKNHNIFPMTTTLRKRDICSLVCTRWFHFFFSSIVHRTNQINK